MKADTIVTLGDFTFADSEIPSEIAFGLDQLLSVQRQVGGTRNINLMGPDPHPLEWSGLIRGSNALDRALYLQGIASSGAQVDLVWDQLAFSVVVRSFRANFQRFYQIPYSIVCEVVEDLTSPVRNVPAPTTDSAVADDVDAGQLLVDGLGFPSLTAAYASVTSAIKTVSAFASATTAQINAILAPIAAMRSQITRLLASATNTLQSVTTVGGILPNNPLARNVANLTGQVTAMNQSYQFVRLDSILGRVSKNVGNAVTGQQTVTVAGGNLFRIASEQYGDAMGWATIAKANDLTDPQISGVQTLVIPPNNVDSGGVLGG